MSSIVRLVREISRGYIFHIFQHFTTKLCNFTKLKMLFNAVIMNFILFRNFSKFCPLCNRSIVGSCFEFNIINMSSLTMSPTFKTRIETKIQTSTCLALHTYQKYNYIA